MQIDIFLCKCSLYKSPILVDIDSKLMRTLIDIKKTFPLTSLLEVSSKPGMDY